MKRFKFLITSCFLLSSLEISSAETFKDYYAFTKYWDTHNDEWEALYKANKDYGFRWMVEKPISISYAYHTNPIAFCEIVAFNGYLLAVWRKNDPVEFKAWTATDNCHECMRKHPELIGGTDYDFTTAILGNFPDLFVVFTQKTPKPNVLGWAKYSPEAFNKVYQGDIEARKLIDSDPELKALIKPVVS